jgi:hypothetical protein
MAAVEREDSLNEEIERAKQDLARDLDDLRSDATDLGRKVAIAVGVAVAAYATFRIVRFVMRRRG